MGLEKAIQHNKEFRKKYFGSKQFDRSCRNHGSCDYCKNNRLFQTRKIKSALKADSRELYS